MLYELRMYHTVPGRLPALHDRFANHTMRLFKKHGIGMLGFWTDEIGETNKLTYMVTFGNMAEREARQGALVADPEWNKVRAESVKDGPIVDRRYSRLMKPTPYSPEPQIRSEIQELRIYQPMPEKLPDLHARFANLLSRYFKKYGMEEVGYWTDEVGAGTELVYMLDYPNLEHREKSWAAFRADPERLKAVEESEKHGPLVRVARSTILRSTHYSPRD